MILLLRAWHFCPPRAYHYPWLRQIFYLSTIEASIFYPQCMGHIFNHHGELYLYKIFKRTDQIRFTWLPWQPWGSGVPDAPTLQKPKGWWSDIIWGMGVYYSWELGYCGASNSLSFME